MTKKLSPFKMPGFSGFGNLDKSVNKTVTDLVPEGPSKKSVNSELITLLQEEDAKKEEVETAISSKTDNKESLV